jgi:peptide/nickel transport system permease protein
MTKHRKKQQDRLTAAAVSGKPFADAWRNFTRHPVSMIAMCVLIVLILTAIVSGVAFDYDKDIVAINPAERMQAPNANHWFGTDDFGRDLFARILYGSRYSLFIGITVSAIAMVLGMLIGASCAYFGGVYDALVMRLMDAIICIPSMLLMLALAAAFGKGMNGIIASLIIVNVPGYARIIRSIVLGVVHQEYVEAAVACGTPHWKIILRHVLPNCFGPILVDVLMSVAGTIMAASSLSFLGMGIQVPAPEWGAMLSQATKYLQSQPYLAIFPGMAILVTSLTFNLIGDGLTDALDPKNR